MSMNNENLEAQINKAHKEEPQIANAKQVDVIMLESESVISPAVAEDKPKTYSNAPIFANTRYENQKSRRSSFVKRALLTGAGVLVLLSVAVLSAILFSDGQDEQQPSISQQTQPGISNVPAASEQQPSQPPQTVSEKNIEADNSIQSDNPKIKESAPVVMKNSASTTEVKRDVQNPAFEKPQLPQPPAAAAAALDGNTQTELNASLNKWIDATNERNVEQQMTYYAPKLNSFYLSRNASINSVRNEKKRVFDGAETVDIKAEKPQIVLSRDGRTATMLFRKKYNIKKGQLNRNGEVLQEMKWVKSGNGWKIVSERDLKVINK